MGAPILWQWLGRRAYDRALAQQETCWRERREGGPDVVLAVEHPPTITFGKRSTAVDLDVADGALAARGIAHVTVDRGGRATFHGPGQLVLYPIIALAARGFGVAEFVWTLEQIMIEVAARVGIIADRDQRGHGVWTNGAKLGAVGIRVREGVSLHGLALNVTTDLAAFDLITPCGLPDVHVTSLRAQGAHHATVTNVLAIAEEIAPRLLGASHSDVRSAFAADGRYRPECAGFSPARDAHREA
jgi:lipoyl(octanoyl) transferase